MKQFLRLFGIMGLVFFVAFATDCSCGKKGVPAIIMRTTPTIVAVEAVVTEAVAMEMAVTEAVATMVVMVRPQQLSLTEYQILEMCP